MERLGRRGFIALLLAASCFAAGTAAALLRTPVQVSDALETILRASRSSTPFGAFARSLSYSSQMLRPMDYASANFVLHAARTLNIHDGTAFRVLHASLATSLVALFTAAARPRHRTDLVAFPIALTMLVGLHGFAGMMREAYPINHFLVVTIGALLVLVLAQSPGGWLADAAATVAFAFCLLSVEAGILIIVVAFSAWAAGYRGISRRALAAIAGIAGVYLAWRIGYLHIRGAGVGDHSTGFGNAMLSPRDQVARFGAHPLVFFVYNACSAIASVLFSEPRDGVWALAGIHETPAGLALPPPSIFIEIVSSACATSLLAWAATRWWRGRLADRSAGRAFVVAAAVIAASGALSYAYNKDEIISTAGVFYVLAVLAALREALVTIDGMSGAKESVAASGLVFLSLIWSWRALGFEYKMLRSATFAREEWATVLPPTGPGKPELETRDRPIAASLKADAEQRSVLDYRQLPHWMERYWGE